VVGAAAVCPCDAGFDDAVLLHEGRHSSPSNIRYEFEQSGGCVTKHQNSGIVERAD
jgi:hypothetical protein